MKPLAFRFDWRITLLTVVTLPLLLTLGFWQLNRADEKRDILNQLESRKQLAPVPIDSVSVGTNDLAFLPVQITGTIDQEHMFLLDNRVYNGLVGYDLVVPFAHQQANGEPLWVLVNLGWLQAPNRREQLPELPPLPNGVVTIDVEIYIPPGDAYVLAEQQLEKEWPQVIQTVDVTAIATLLGEGFYPHQLRIIETTHLGLPIDWTAINVTPQKHIGYAVQWFGMALGLVIWFIFASRKKHDDTN